ncbi:Mur ligase family protein [Jannaschia sp. S6380]|uniref:Mur ligase family protein n=1 Tax=Jannaschia sp. S6380 TaxID=2926408 RepID=UPI001FF23F2F|nr:Mur ligase family protein [Jannaschia sp. S6380]MCK0168408.1 Mur ligase family protein [Jannaschia sp. S6380]
MLRVTSLQHHDGVLFGLNGRTARVQIEGLSGADPGRLADMAAPTGGDALFPPDPISGYLPGDWLAGCLIGGRGGDAIRDLSAGLPVALQILAGCPVGPAQIVGGDNDMIRIALPWHMRALSRAALKLALDLLNAHLDPAGDAAQALDETRRVLARARTGGLTPAGTRIGVSAARRGMPLAILNGGVLQVGWGARARQFKSTFTDRSPSIGEQLARAKAVCTMRLDRGGLPVPQQHLATDADAARRFAATVGWPVVVKPAGLDQGRGIHLDIEDEAALDTAFAQVAALDGHGVLVEAQVPGDDHRFLIANNRVVAVARRLPGGVTGDGRASVTELLDRVNADPRRGTDKDSLSMRIEMDDEARDHLAAAGLTPDDVPEAGRFVALRRTPNISTGGTAEDVVDRVHPDNAMIALRAARLIGLDVAGVDFLSPDISRSYREVGGAICEVNSQPGLRPHWIATPDRDVTGAILDAVLDGAPARIPTAAVTGSKGKTTTAMMLHRIWQCTGRVAGVNGTAGTWVGDDRVDMRNLTGVPGAILLFNDPAVEAAVLEMPRKGLLTYGHACDRYDVAALTNVQSEHLGQDGIETREEMADLKGELLLRARDAIVINAEDDQCRRIAAKAAAPRQILVAMDAEGPTLAAHLAAGGDGVFVAPQDGRDWITMARGARRVPVLAVEDIPATMGGRLEVNIRNAMFAAALADAQNLPARAIREGLSSFRSSREMNPGRYNQIEGFPFDVLVDYAHSVEGVAQLTSFVRDMPVAGRRHAGVRILGNSGPDKIGDTAAYLVRCFDRITMMPDIDMIRKFGRYTGEDPVGEMLSTAGRMLKEAGAREGQVTLARDHVAGCDALFDEAAPGDLLVLMVDPPLAYDTIDRRRADKGTGATTPPPADAPPPGSPSQSPSSPAASASDRAR